MKKNIAFTVLLVISWHLLFSQNPYFDALVIRKYYKSVNNGKVLFTINSENVFELGKLFRTYGLTNNLSEEEINTEIRELLNRNPFLSVVPTQEDNEFGLMPLNLSMTLLSSFGGLNLTNFADGLARFLVKRMKEELNIVFFEQFEKELEKQKDLRRLFPSTYSILSIAKKNEFIYPINIRGIDSRSWTVDWINSYCCR